MDDNSVLEEIKKILLSNRCPLQDIDGEVRIDELEMDSVSLTNALMELEEHLRIVVLDEVWVRWQKVQDIIDFIDQYRQEYGKVNFTEL